MTDIVSNFMPAAFGILASPMPVVLLLVLIFTPKGKVNSAAFALGWVAGIIVLAILVLALGLQAPTGDPSTLSGIVQLIVGALFLFFAIQQFRGRPKPGAPPATPKWMTTVETMSPVAVFGIGAVLATANAKNLPLIISTALQISAAELPWLSSFLLIVIFALIGSLLIIGIVIAFWIFGDQIAEPLEKMREWLQHNAWIIMMVLFGFLGLSALSGGIAIVFG